MKVYAYTPANGLNWEPAAQYESLGQCSGKHYFAIPDDEEIPEQPAEIGFAPVTDVAELRHVLATAPYFFRWKGTADLTTEAAKVGIVLE
ncbi:hypothetical protein CCC_01395 [Paramagnetospirillum magnetotacticum MS-1]|uniref:Uncharacterized protein n=1 Tax=Paramagnetospirillum magnetotacticum MS-1 TaxID=272627 RepID=A0A0C2U624_PARME|nr:hypothetical protein [Paramagnetospirillum magnetotacticum]KIL96902.1 hypothetical protein CCC_01395 [Paramagnetospirillum magnetotacticum MS-1]